MTWLQNGAVQVWVGDTDTLDRAAGASETPAEIALTEREEQRRRDAEFFRDARRRSA